MSLHAAAKHMATKGRGSDSMLVHMTPKEVNGLQALAKASGGSLTINPDTGLVEAGFLSDILPVIAAAGLTYLTAGAAAPAIAGALSGTMGAAAATTAGGILAGAGSGASYQNDKIYGVNGPFNVPFGPLNYNSLNVWCRNWIAQLTLALSTELLGRVRGKFKSFPIPGADLSLNGDDLVSQGREDKDKLITSMRESLDNLTFDKIAEREASKAENTVKQLQFIPVPPKYTIFIA